MLSVALEQICLPFGGTVIDRHPRQTHDIIIVNAAIQTLMWSLVSALMLLTGGLNIVVISVGAVPTRAIGEATDVALRSVIGTCNYT